MLRRVAAGMAAGSLLLWLVLGANVGWTKTTVTKWHKDPVTELEGPVYEPRFQPGVDLLAVSLLAAAAVFAASLFAPRTAPSNPGPKFVEPK